MNSLNRFLYGTIVSSLIVWTIYLLTIDFYSIAFVPYQYKHLTHIPFPGSWLNLYFLAIVNLATILVIFCSAFITQFKNFKVVSTPICNIESSEEKIQA
ncbi:unnamed protein product [Commensalibacter papalotli (ex Botero et al. 2024)]|uniref:Uncharacterized protein n=2 Tax=Commensalibacter TaxID=1079922 RepID=W7DPA8_9PROT|nr:hypothetical protein COMX_05485 [Commensalibacter papalotli (ex Servin-Garciduenas et al. 2014)]CAI3930698.1 unnamed protein product [Commensalibacter papalotli (ex Botero et al. 2024)]CAI3947957.1 unnamed protein product [Commensalibacter papalotli (ex Botero et al. 2024)]